MLVRQQLPDRVGRGLCGQLARQIGGTGDVAQPGEESDRYAHAACRARPRASSSSGIRGGALDPDDPRPSKNSCFQIGVICLMRSDGVAARPRTRRRDAVTRRRWPTLASPIDSLPMRWCSATCVSGPALAGLGRDALEGLHRQRLVRFVFQPVHTATPGSRCEPCPGTT